MRKFLTVAAVATFTLSGCGLLPGVRQYDTIADGPGQILKPYEIENAVPRDEPLSELGNKSPYSVNGRFNYVMEDPTHYRARGKASWYGTKFHGRKTSSGEPFDMYEMTAAHRNLPLPTYVEVTNLDTGKVAIVKVNDRGPFVDDRLIDLSYAAAVKLGMMEAGTASVEIRAISGADIARAREQAETDAAEARARGGGEAVLSPTRDDRTLEIAQVMNAGQEVADDHVVSSEQAEAAIEQVEEVGGEAAAVAGAAVADTASSVAETAPAPAPSPVPAAGEGPQLAIQVGAFGKLDQAVSWMEKVQELIPAIPVFVAEGSSNGNPIYRTRIGPVHTRQTIDEVSRALNNGGVTDMRVLPMAGGGDCVAGCR